MNLMWKKISTIAFFSVLVVFAGASFAWSDEEVSKSERRKLTQLPAFSVSAVLDGSYMEKLEEYLKDQFVGRDLMRALKAETELTLFGKADTAGYYRVEDALYQHRDAVEKKNVQWAAEHFSEIAGTYFPEAEIYYAVIPDKEEYLTGEDRKGQAVSQSGSDETKVDEVSQSGSDEKKAQMVREEKLQEKQESQQTENWMSAFMPEATCIPIREVLDLEDYYRTDLHWRQECIVDVAEVLVEEMAMSTNPTTTEEDEIFEKMEEDGTSNRAEGAWVSERTQRDWSSEKAGLEVATATTDFQGGNAAGSALWVEPETMYYVTNPTIEGCMVYDYEKGAEVSVYSWERLEEGTDPYDFYLWGARALLTIKNPNASEGAKKLLLFRDSFGSSIAPLLVSDYAEITLVDLRYVQMDYAAELLGELDYDDVLFLYSVNMLNHSGTFRF